MTGAEMAAAAAQLVGTPFRLHGRDPASGLDCIGVLAAALASCGRAAYLPNGYALRNRVLPELSGFVAGNSLLPATGCIASGDVLLVRAGPGQFHVLIAASEGNFVHANASLKRVICSALPVDWPIIAHWRLAPPGIEEK